MFASIAIVVLGYQHYQNDEYIEFMVEAVLLIASLAEYRICNTIDTSTDSIQQLPTTEETI